MKAPRQLSVDVLRGLVMVIMAIDHTRDFVHWSAMNFPPEDLARTSPAIFFTRWITHICAPTFMLCAGLGAWFRLERNGNVADLSRFLWTRGLWLVLLEVTAVHLGFMFRLDYSVVILLVFWALGLSMIALALLVRLPFRALLAVCVAMVLLHNLADGVQAARLGSFAWLWTLLHQQGLLMQRPAVVIVGYPLVPWIGVMGLGFCLGRVYRLPPERRRPLLLRIGLTMTVAFVLLRGLNVYGDPRPWSVQGRPLFTLLSFLNTTKYPPSLAFLLMTLGPALLLLGWFERAALGERHPFVVFGRTPLFFFVAHIPLIHSVAIAMTWVRYGAAPFLFVPPPTMGTPRQLFPPDYGWPLWVVYAVTAAVVAALYPLCLWLSRLKQRRREWWLSYL